MVTGASRGIGYFAARELANQGAHIIAIARTVGGLEQLDDEIKDGPGSATLVPMDITDYEAIDRLGGAIAERWGKLDGFFGNAGILGGLSPLAHVDPKTFEKTFAINVTANFRFLRSFDALFRKSEAARVLLASSGAAKSCRAYWNIYAASKAALEAMAKSYAAECANTDITVNLLDPGVAATAMRAQAMPGEDPQTIAHPRDLAPMIADLLHSDDQPTGKIFDIATKQWSA